MDKSLNDLLSKDKIDSIISIYNLYKTHKESIVFYTNDETFIDNIRKYEFIISHTIFYDIRLGMYSIIIFNYDKITFPTHKLFHNYIMKNNSHIFFMLQCLSNHEYYLSYNNICSHLKNYEDQTVLEYIDDINNIVKFPPLKEQSKNIVIEFYITLIDSQNLDKSSR